MFVFVASNVHECLSHVICSRLSEFSRTCKYREFVVQNITRDSERHPPVNAHMFGENDHLYK